MYRFATQRENYEDYSSGRVLYGKASATNFPVRLASEIFQRCSRFLEESGRPPPYAVYDPLCGVAYTLTVLGFLHGHSIKCLLGSDNDLTILEVAADNLNLLTKEGLGQRTLELTDMLHRFSKDSHAGALESAGRLTGLQELLPSIKTAVFHSDAMACDADQPLFEEIDMVLVDLPYGVLTEWKTDQSTEDPVQKMLDNLMRQLPRLGIVAVASQKGQKYRLSGYTKAARFQVGKRQVILLDPTREI